MTAATKTSVDGNTNTGALEIYIDGNLETTYVWDGTNFVLSERLNDVTLSKADLAQNTADIEAWYELVQRHCQVSYVFAPHSADIDDKATRVVYRLRFGEENDILAIHAIFHKNDSTTEFKARDALTLAPYEFARFTRTLKLMLGQPVEGWISG